MAQLEELVVKLQADTEGLRTEMKAAAAAAQMNGDKIAKALAELNQANKKEIGGLQRIWETAAGVVGGNLITSAIGVAKDAFVGLFNVMIVDGVAAAKEQQIAQNNLAQALGRTGKYSEEAANDLYDYSDALEQTTMYSGEAVLESAALIQNLAKLDTQGLKKATSGAADLAAVLNIDLNTAASTVAKAINGNVTGLNKYGIAVQEGSTKAETLANVMRALGNIQGAAQAKSQTFQGGIQQLGNAFEDITKAIGGAIIESPALTAALAEAGVAVRELATWFQENQQTLREWVGYGVMFAVTALKTLVDTMGMVAEVFGGSDTLANASVALEKIGNAAADGMGQTLAGVKAATPPVMNIISAFDKMSEAMQNAATAGQTLSQDLIMSTKSTQEQYEAQAASLDLAYGAMRLSDEAYLTEKQELLLETYEKEQEMLDAALQGQLISKSQHEEATVQLAQRSAEKMDAIQKAAADRMKARNDQEVADRKATFDEIASLSSSSNKTLSAIGKAAAIRNASINTYEAANKALASAPPPFGFALAALVTAAGVANVAKIAGFKDGINSVPGTGNNDSFPAMLAPGERVVPKKTNQDLTEALKNGGVGGSGNTYNFSIQIGDVYGDDSGTVLIEKINQSIRRGLAILETGGV